MTAGGLVGPARVVLVVSLSALLLGGFAGCLSGSGPSGTEEISAKRPLAKVTEDLRAQLEALRGLDAEPLVLETNPTIHVVFAGVPADLVDEEAIRARLPAEYRPINTVRSGTWGPTYHEPLRYTYEVAFHHAPDAFVRDYFAFALDAARSAPPTPFLCAYDRDWGHDRLSQHGPPEVCYKGYASYDSGVVLPPGQDAQLRPVRLVPVEKAERWIAENRERHGLAFEQPSYTVFYFDGWSSGAAPRDAYHYYESTGDRDQNVDTQTLRAWGGSWDFLFMDLSAAPNNALYDNSEKAWIITRLGVTAGYGTAERDPPIWDYDADGHWERTVCRAETPYGPTQVACPDAAPDAATPPGESAQVRSETRTLELNDRLGENLRYGLQLYMMPSFVYRPEYQPTYFINFHLYQESESIKPRDRIADWVDMDAILSVLRTEIPWATFDGELKTYLLPNDDPGMALAVKRAKAEGYGTYVPTKPIQNYVDANLERYTRQEPGIFNVKVFSFNWDAHWTVAFPLVVSGVGAGDAEGRPWGIVQNVNDVEYYAYDPGNGHEYTMLTAHEVGHFFGFHHPHDGAVRAYDPATGEHGAYAVTVEWTWDQVATPMSYRMAPPVAGQMDRDHIARGHTALNVNAALRDVRATLETLLDGGATAAPPEVARSLRATRESVASAIDLFEQGLWIDAVHASIAALGHAREARTLAAEAPPVEVVLAEWTADGTTHAAKRVPAVPLATSQVESTLRAKANVRQSTTGHNPYHDYRAVGLDPAFEKVVVEVAWSNTGASAADLFAGWSFEDPATWNPGTRGSYDFVPEALGDGAHLQRFVLDLNYTDVWRDGLGTNATDPRADGTLWVGAGSTEPLVNAAYAVRVVAYARPAALVAAVEGADPAGATPTVDDLVAAWRAEARA